MKKTKIVVLGGGFAGVYVFRHFQRSFREDKSVSLALVNRTNYFLFTPLLHEVATGGISADNVVESLPKIIANSNADFYEGEVRKIHTQEKRVELSNMTLPYDYLVLALGSQTNFFHVKGAAEHSFTLKSYDDAVKLKNHCIDCFERASDTQDPHLRAELLHFVVVGGGPTGVELSAEMADFFFQTFVKLYSKHEFTSQIAIDLIQRETNLLPQFSFSLRERAEAVLRKKGVHVLLNTEVCEVGRNYVLCGGGKRVAASTVIWVAGVCAASAPFDVEVAKNPGGKLLVESTLQLKGHPSIYALGDMACISDACGYALPPLAQVATKEARAVAHNIHRMVKGNKPRAFHYRHSGDLISLGRFLAIAEIHGFHSLGRFAWWLWRTVYLLKMISWRKRMKVALDWTINLFTERDVSKL